MAPLLEPELFTVWPLRDEPRLAGSLLAVVIGLAGAAAWATSSLLLGSGVLLSLGVCTWRMWLPNSLQIDHAGVRLQTMGRWRQLNWGDVVRCQQRPHGLLLLQTASSSPLALANGLYLRYGSDRQRLRDAIERCYPELLGIVDETAFSLDETAFRMNVDEEPHANTMPPPAATEPELPSDPSSTTGSAVAGDLEP